MADGIKKNLKKMEAAKKRLKTNQRVKDALRRLDESKFFSLGKDNYFHCLMNVITETTRAEPYYVAHLVAYTVLALVASAIAGWALWTYVL